VAQVAGGFIGAAIVYQMYGPVIDQFNAAHHLSRAVDGGAAGVFFTAPGAGITVMHAFIDQIIQTAILLFGIFAITCQFNTQAPQANAGALIIGLLVAAIGASCGNLEAWALNPARDFGPRLFCFLAGWDRAAIPAANSYWWVPVAGPVIGGIVGAGLYQFTVRPFMPNFVVTPGSRPVVTDPGEPKLVVTNDPATMPRAS